MQMKNVGNARYTATSRAHAKRFATPAKPKSLETTELMLKTLLRIEEKGEVLAAYVGLMGLHTGLRTGGAQCIPQGMWKMLEAAIDRVTKKVDAEREMAGGA